MGSQSFWRCGCTPCTPASYASVCFYQSASFRLCVCPLWTSCLLQNIKIKIYEEIHLFKVRWAWNKEKLLKGDVVKKKLTASTRGITGGQGAQFPWRWIITGTAKRPNNVTSTFLNTVHLLPKDLFGTWVRQTCFLPRAPSNLLVPLPSTADPKKTCFFESKHIFLPKNAGGTKGTFSQNSFNRVNMTDVNYKPSWDAVTKLALPSKWQTCLCKNGIGDLTFVFTI